MSKTQEWDECPDPPDLKADDHQTNGLMCFFDSTRECGADCMGFLTEPVEAPILNPQQRNCVFVVSVERVGRYLSGLVTLTRKRQEDQQRASHSQPPNPLGPKR